MRVQAGTVGQTQTIDHGDCDCDWPDTNEVMLCGFDVPAPSPLPSPTGNAQLNLRATAATATLATLSKPMWQTDLLTIIYSYVLYSEPWQLIRVIAHFETVYQTQLCSSKDSSVRLPIDMVIQASPYVMQTSIMNLSLWSKLQFVTDNAQLEEYILVWGVWNILMHISYQYQLYTRFYQVVSHCSSQF